MFNANLNLIFRFTEYPSFFYFLFNLQIKILSTELNLIYTEWNSDLSLLPQLFNFEFSIS